MEVLTVEVQVAAAGQSVEGVFAPDFHRVEGERIIPKFDLECSQTQGHLEEFFAEDHGSVFSNHPFDAGVEERVDVFGVFDLPDGRTVCREAFVRALAGGAVFAQVVGGGDPAGEGGVEFSEAVNMVASHAQGQFEVALDGLNEAFDFAFRPGVIGLGVQEADAEVGAGDFGVVVDEGFSLVGVELEGKTPAQDRLFEAVQKRGGVGFGIICPVGNESAVVVEQQAEMGGKDFAIGSPQGRTTGEVHHPQVVGRGCLEGFCRAAFQPPGLETAGVVAVGGKEAAHGAFRGQPAPVVLPHPVEHREGNPGAFFDGIKDPQPGLLVEEAASSGILASGFSGDAAVAVLGVIIPPSLNGSVGVIAPVLRRPWARGGGPQAFGQRESFFAQGFDVANDLEAQQRPAFIGFWCRVVHDETGLEHPPPLIQSKGFVGWRAPAPKRSSREGFPFPKCPQTAVRTQKGGLELAG